MLIIHKSERAYYQAQPDTISEFFKKGWVFLSREHQAEYYKRYPRCVDGNCRRRGTYPLYRNVLDSFEIIKESYIIGKVCSKHHRQGVR